MRLVPVTLFIAAALVGTGTSVALAADQCPNFDSVVSTFQSRGANVTMIPVDRLPAVSEDTSLVTGDTYEGVTRGFLAQGTSGVVIGLEVGGCLMDPIIIKPPVHEI